MAIFGTILSGSQRLEITGSIHGASTITTNEPFVLSGTLYDTTIATNQEIGAISWSGTEDGGANLVGGSKIRSFAAAAFNPGGSQVSTKFEILNTKTGDLQPITALQIDGGSNNAAVFHGKIKIADTASAATVAGENAAVGYSSVEGITITGQGSTNDVTIRNDADAEVFGIPTGTTNVSLPAGKLLLGSDADGADRKLTFGHATLKSCIGVDDSGDVFAINTDQDFEASNDLEIDASGNVTIGNGNLIIDGGEVRGPTDGQLKLYSDDDVIVEIDSDNSNNTAKFIVAANNETPKFRIDEEGNVHANGFLLTSGSGTNSMAGDLAVAGTMQAGSYLSNIDIEDRIRHIGDTDTQMRFSAANTIAFEAGGVQMQKWDGNSSPKANIFNDSGSDIDFRIESNSGETQDDFAFYLDSSTGRIGLAYGDANALAVDSKLSIKGFVTLKDPVSSDIMMKLTGSADDASLDLYSNNAVGAQIKAAGTSFVTDDFRFGGDILGPTDGSMDIKSDGNVNIHLDEDNDGTNNFKVVNGANGALFTILEASGDTTIAGDVTISGNNIMDAGGAAGITFDGSGNTKIDGELTLGDNLIKTLDGTTAITVTDSSGNTAIAGRLNFAEYGRLVSGADLGTDGEWIKVATLQDPVTNTQAASSVAIQVTIVGRQNYATSHSQTLKQATIHLSHENDGGSGGMGTPAFYVDIISAMAEGGFGGSDTAWTKDDFILTHATSSPYNAEIWVKAEANTSASNLEAYASIVGGSTGEQTTSSYVNYWKLNTGQSWSGSAGNLGTQRTAEYPTRPVGYLYSEEGVTIGKAFTDTADRYVKIKVGSGEKAGITMTESTTAGGTGEIGTTGVYGFEMRYDGSTNDLEFVRAEVGSLNTCLRITREAGHIYALDTAGNTTGTAANMHIDSTSGEIFRSTSDRRGKKEIAELTSSLDDICKLIPRQFYDVKDENNENLIPGFVSDEVESVIPLLVPDRNISDPEIYRSVSYDRVCAYIVNALKEIKQRLEDLESNS